MSAAALLPRVVLLLVLPRSAIDLLLLLDVRMGGWGEHVKLVAVDVIGAPQANALPTSAAFYLSIPREHLLLIQADAIALRSVYLPGPATSPELLRWMEEFIYM